MNRWNSGGETYVQFGLLQIAANPRLNGYEGDKAWWNVDPPIYRQEVLEWLRDHGGRVWDPGAFGPPGFVFPTDELADEFVKTFDPTGIRDFMSAGALPTEGQKLARDILSQSGKARAAAKVTRVRRKPRKVRDDQ